MQYPVEYLDAKRRYATEWLGEKPNLWEIAISLTGLSVWVVWFVSMVTL